MRYENKILVMRRAPMIGRPTSAPRVTVCHRALRFEWALETALYELARDRAHGIRSGYWIVKAGQAAHRRGVSHGA